MHVFMEFLFLPFNYYSPFKRQQFKSLNPTVDSLKEGLCYSEVQATGKVRSLQV